MPKLVVQRKPAASRLARPTNSKSTMSSRLARLIGNTNTNPGRGAWLALGMGLGTAVGVLTGSLLIGLGVSAIAGAAVAARGAGR